MSDSRRLTCPKPRAQRGVTLVELVVFITIAGLLAVGLTSVFTAAMRGVATGGDVNQVLALAQERMELVLAQRHRQGFSAFVDPCTLPGPPVQCTGIPAGFTIAPVVITNNWNGSNEFRQITVTVNGPQTITLTAVVASY